MTFLCSTPAYAVELECKIPYSLKTANWSYDRNSKVLSFCQALQSPVSGATALRCSPFPYKVNVPANSVRVTPADVEKARNAMNSKLNTSK